MSAADQMQAMGGVRDGHTRHWRSICGRDPREGGKVHLFAAR